MASRPVVTITPAPVDPLEAEAVREVDLLTRAAEYLTIQIRKAQVRTCRQRTSDPEGAERIRAMVRERNSIEWDAWQLESALNDYRRYLDSQAREINLTSA